MHAVHNPAIDAALSAAASLLGMEVVFVSTLTDDALEFSRVLGGGWPGVEEGACLRRTDSLCDRLLRGAPPVTTDAAQDPAYRDAAAVELLTIKSYVGVPIVDGSGRVLGTLCGIDHGTVDVPADALNVLTQLAAIIAESLEGGETQVHIRRTPGGWRVESPDGVEPVDELTSAMVLADLLTAELAPGSRPPRPDGELDEVERLKVSVRQLEHALAARVVIEQAIGVLSERLGIAPRSAFDRLRKAARSRGRKVHDLAREVAASAVDRAVPLPPELSGRR